MRRYILQFTIKNFIDYNGIDIFKDATVDSSVILIKRESSINNQIFINNDYFFKQNHLSDDVWVFEKPKIFDMKEKISKNNKLISEINDIQIFYGIKTGYNNAFIITKESINMEEIDNNSKSTIKPVLRGKDISKYHIDYKNLYLIYLKWGDDLNNFPYLKEHLSQYKEQLSNRAEVKQNKYNWWCLSRYCSNYINEFEKPKLIWQRVCKRPNFVLDTENKYYIIDSMVFLTLKTQKEYLLEYLLMILNSNVIEWYLKRIGHKLGKTGFLLSNQYVNKLPIPFTSLENQQKIKQSVNKLIALKSDKNADTDLISYYENQLNKEVYTLFKLNLDEINIIEEELN